MSEPTIRDFRCSHGKGWAEDTWTLIPPKSFGTPRGAHVDKARAAAGDRRQGARELDTQSASVAARHGADFGQGLRADLLRMLAEADEADAAGHMQVRCPTCGFTERILHRDYADLSNWCAEVGLDAIPLRSVRQILIELGVI